MPSTWKIYHNPRCSKSRQALDILRSHKIEPLVIEYLVDGLDAKTVEALIIGSGVPPDAFLRKKEKDFAEYRDTRIDTAKSVAKILAECPKLLERPVVVLGKKVIIARPPELVKELL
jgi:arsenate reductase